MASSSSSALTECCTIYSDVFFNCFLQGWENIIVSKYFSNISKKDLKQMVCTRFPTFCARLSFKANAQRLDCSSKSLPRVLHLPFSAHLNGGKGKIVFAGRGIYSTFA